MNIIYLINETQTVKNIEPKTAKWGPQNLKMRTLKGTQNGQFLLNMDTVLSSTKIVNTDKIPLTFCCLGQSKTRALTSVTIQANNVQKISKKSLSTAV